MDVATYRGNVLKTLSIKPAKLGLKYVARNTARTCVAHAAVGIASEVAELVAGLSPYLLGESRLTEPMKVNAFEEMGDIGYYLVVMAKYLKVKLPSASKKVRLKGMTRGRAIMDLLTASSTLLDLYKKMYYGPKMAKAMKDKRTTTIDPKTNVSSSTMTKQEVDVANPALTDVMYAERNAKMASALVERVIPLYWALCFDLFDVTPANLFVGNIAKLSQRYGSGFFVLSEAEERDTVSEITEMTAAATQAPVSSKSAKAVTATKATKVPKVKAVA